jgi:hypothetical protein
MLVADAEQIDRASTKVRVRWHGATLSFAAALELCRTDEGFRSQLIAALTAAPFAAYFWETPPATTASLSRPFEFVLTDAPSLAKASPETAAFQEHFDADNDGDGIVVFENLGRDAALVVPCPLASTEKYVHLAAFLRGAPEPQKHALLQCVAAEMLSRVSARPLWLSTAGMGVYWLHIRLDSRPKYYRHAPYKALE